MISIFAILLLWIAFGERFGIPIPGKTYFASKIIDGGDLTLLPPISTPSEAKELPLPSNEIVGKGTPITELDMNWNAQLSRHEANGGLRTTKGSLIAKRGVDLTIKPQNDTEKMKEALMITANAYAPLLRSGHGEANPQLENGANLVIIMGDGAAAFVTGLQKNLDKIGLHVQIVAGTGGRSNEEDAFMIPPEWVLNPELARGGLASVYPLDGDQNLIFQWCRFHKIPINTNGKYFDNNALNILETNDFVEAGNAYIKGTTETRPEIANGKPVGGPPITKTVNCTATWTPKDVDIVTKKGGLVKAQSTKDSWQMPATVVGIKEFNDNHRKAIKGILAATFEASDQIRKFDKAFYHAAGVSAKIYGAETADYWASFARGKVLTDSQGNKVRCGGSASLNLAENLYMYGLLPDQRTDQYAITYNTFAKYQKEAYPTRLEAPLKYEDVIDKSYLLEIASENQAASTINSATDVNTFTKSSEVKEVVAKGSWDNIRFRSGSADILPESEPVLNEIANLLSLNKQYVIITGHTDSDGNADANTILGQRRADAVGAYFTRKFPGLFSNNRITTKSKGASEPIVPNNIAGGKAKNRRVVIELVNR